jgi:hypothetical protein
VDYRNFFLTKKFRRKECRVDDVWPGHEGRGREGEGARGWDGGGGERKRMKCRAGGQ